MAQHKLVIEKKTAIKDFAVANKIIGVIMDMWVERKSFKIELNFKVLFLH